MAGITSGSLNKVHLRPTVSTEKTGREVPRHRERLLWPRGRGAGGGDSLAPGHTHLRVHVVPRVDAGILQGRGARQPSGPAPPSPPRTSVCGPLGQHLGEQGRWALPTTVPRVPLHHWTQSHPPFHAPQYVVCNFFLLINLIITETVSIYLGSAPHGQALL